MSHCEYQIIGLAKLHKSLDTVPQFQWEGGCYNNQSQHMCFLQEPITAQRRFTAADHNTAGFYNSQSQHREIWHQAITAQGDFTEQPIMAQKRFTTAQEVFTRKMWTPCLEGTEVVRIWVLRSVTLSLFCRYSRTQCSSFQKLTDVRFSSNPE